MSPEILVATDFSEISQRALDFAFALGNQMGAKTVLVHVVEPIEAGDNLDEEARDFHDDLLRKAQASLESEFRRCGIPEGESLALLGPRVSTLLDLAEQRKPWLMVFGRNCQSTHQAGVGLKFLVQSNRPVLSIG